MCVCVCVFVFFSFLFERKIGEKRTLSGDGKEVRMIREELGRGRNKQYTLYVTYFFFKEK